MSKQSTVPPAYLHPEGRLKLEYRSYDGVAVVGIPPWVFRTRWSPAGNGSIHAYNYEDGIDAIAIAQGVASIDMVTPAVVSRSDFTCKDRMVRAGQVILFRNSGGYMAAFEVEEVTHTLDGEPGNVLTARYKILTDGSQDFSGAAASPDEVLRAAAADALAAMPPSEVDATPATPGMGHNNPPGGPLSPAQREEISEVLQGLSRGDIKEGSTEEQKSFVRRVIDFSLSAVFGYIKVTAKQAAEAANKAIFAGYIADITSWKAFLDKLERVWSFVLGWFK